MVKTSRKINSTTTTNNTHKKTTQGRKKIEIKKINEKSNLQVTFSKRRNGLFKKANELCLLCGAEVAVITFSPGRKAYTFGHPGVEELVDRYLGRRDDGVEKGGERHAEHVAYVNEANKEYEDLLKQLEEERKRGEELEESKKKKTNLIEGGSGGFWWEETDVDELGLEELEVYVKSMQELQEHVVKRISELNMMESLLLISNNNANNNSNLYDVNCNNNIGGGELMLINSNVNQNTAGGNCSGSNFIGGNYGGCKNGGCNCEGGDGVVNEFGFRGMGF